MKNYLKTSLLLASILMMAACSKKDYELTTPINAADFPQQVILDDKGDGGVEDEDKMEIKVVLTDRLDPSGTALAGAPQPLTEPVTVNFMITGLKGFSVLSDYIKGGKAFYEIDDCTTSEDQSIDLHFQMDAANGTGSFLFPVGTTEVIIELELEESKFDDGIKNPDARGFTFSLTGLQNSAGSKVVVNTYNRFEYEVLDDEVIFATWELDASDSAAFASFKTLFAWADEDISGLVASDIDKIEVEFGYDKVEIKISLTETETVTECGQTEIVNKEIEIEGEYEELTRDNESGDIEFIVEMEDDLGIKKELKYKGGFSITGSNISLTLEGELDDDSTGEFTLPLSK